MIIQRQAPALEFYPVKVFGRHAVFHHGNTIVHRAYDLAEVAAHTFFFLDRVFIIRVALFDID